MDWTPIYVLAGTGVGATASLVSQRWQGRQAEQRMKFDAELRNEERNDAHLRRKQEIYLAALVACLEASQRQDAAREVPGWTERFSVAFSGARLYGSDVVRAAADNASLAVEDLRSNQGPREAAYKAIRQFERALREDLWNPPKHDL